MAFAAQISLRFRILLFSSSSIFLLGNDGDYDSAEADMSLVSHII